MNTNEDSLLNLKSILIVDTLCYKEVTRLIDFTNMVSSQKIEGIRYDEKIQYNPRGDDGIALILLFSFLFSALLIGKNKKGIIQRIKDFFLNKERSSLFSQSMASQVGLILYFSLQSTLLIGMFFLNFFYDIHIDFIDEKNSLMLLGIYTLIIGFYFIIKQLFYRFIGWIFISPKYHNMWLISYNTILAFSSFLLYPFLLLIIYFDLDFNYLVGGALSFFLFIKGIIFYKWINLFLSNMYGLVRLFLYFCGLEILPCLIIYQGFIQVNNHII